MKYGSNEGDKRFSRLIQIVEFYPQTLDSIGIAYKKFRVGCFLIVYIK